MRKAEGDRGGECVRERGRDGERQSHRERGEGESERELHKDKENDNEKKTKEHREQAGSFSHGHVWRGNFTCADDPSRHESGTPLLQVHPVRSAGLLVVGHSPVAPNYSRKWCGLTSGTARRMCAKSALRTSIPSGDKPA